MPRKNGFFDNAGKATINPTTIDINIQHMIENLMKDIIIKIIYSNFI